MAQTRDHGGALDAAIEAFGGTRADWLDLSTGINPQPYRFDPPAPAAWTALPDRDAEARLIAAARRFWAVPDGAAVLAVPGASAAIAHVPRVVKSGTVHIPTPTYNEHAAAFDAAEWRPAAGAAKADAQVVVHPNNPDGRRWTAADLHAPLCIVDESFCDVSPAASLIASATRPGTILLKSFGKFWGLAGLRLGFAIGDPDLVAALAARLGPWPVSGVALDIGAQALEDEDWATHTRMRLDADAARLDSILTGRGARVVGGTPLFRLYAVDDAAAWQTRLARIKVWSRIFPYSRTWLRLGLPPAHGWDRLERDW